MSHNHVVRFLAILIGLCATFLKGMGVDSQTARLINQAPRHSQAQTILFRIQVEPDSFYRGVYQITLESNSNLRGLRHCVMHYAMPRHRSTPRFSRRFRFDPYQPPRWCCYRLRLGRSRGRRSCGLCSRSCRLSNRRYRLFLGSMVMLPCVPQGKNQKPQSQIQQ